MDSLKFVTQKNTKSARDKQFGVNFEFISYAFDDINFWPRGCQVYFSGYETKKNLLFREFGGYAILRN